MVKAEGNRKRSGRCPICEADANDQFRPFCSRRCADIDLSRWFSGNYSVPVMELDENDLDELERFVDGNDPEAGDSTEDGR